MPAALPALASGLRVAAAVAPIGAVVGEWVGSSAGLGYLMLHANARMQVDLMFAALLVLAAMALASVAGRRPRRPRAGRAGSPRTSTTACKDSPDARSPAACCSLLALSLAGLPALAADKLTVILDWFVNPDHGPLIVARERGFFAAEGLEVELIAPADPNDPPKLVAARQADLAVSYQPQLHLQVAQGLPLVRVGTLVATPLNSLVVLADGPVQIARRPEGPQDRLLGRRLRGCAARRHARAPRARALADVELVNVNFSLSPALLAGPGRRGDRRVPQFRAQPDGASSATPAAPSSPRRRACRPMTS